MSSANWPYIGIRNNPIVESPYVQKYSTGGAVPPPPGDNRMITESGDNMITEDGDYMIIE